MEEDVAASLCPLMGHSLGSKDLTLSGKEKSSIRCGSRAPLILGQSTHSPPWGLCSWKTSWEEVMYPLGLRLQTLLRHLFGSGPLSASPGWGGPNCSPGL